MPFVLLYCTAVHWLYSLKQISLHSEVHPVPVCLSLPSCEQTYWILRESWQLRHLKILHSSPHKSRKWMPSIIIISRIKRLVTQGKKNCKHFDEYFLKEHHYLHARLYHWQICWPKLRGYFQCIMVHSEIVINPSFSLGIK